MAKVHPQNQTFIPSTSDDATTSSSSKYSSPIRETFTVWMKSLIFHGNGCTIFNSKGELVFRVDNYQQRCCSASEVFLMNPNGDILFSVQRQKIRMLERWIKGYKWSDSNVMNKEKPWIQVKKCSKIVGGSKMGCCVTDTTTGIQYTITGSDGKSEFKIIDSFGQTIAEAKQKRSSNGVSYGEDVLTLMVEPQIDQLLIVALITVHALLHHRI